VFYPLVELVDASHRIFLDLFVEVRKQCRRGYAKNHLAGDCDPQLGGPFAFLEPRYLRGALVAQEKGKLLLLQSPKTPVGAQVAPDALLHKVRNTEGLIKFSVRITIVILLGNFLKRRKGDIESHRVDMGTFGA